MQCIAKRPCARLALAVGGAASLLLLLTFPSTANVTPESALMVHVQPVTGSCEPGLTNCMQVQGTTAATGPLEFLLFFQPIYWQQSHQPVKIHGLHCELDWPETWELIEFDPCSGWGELSASGPPYALDIEWPYYWWDDCPDLPVQSEGIFLAARFVFNANGPGRFGAYHWWDGGTVELGCPPQTFFTYPRMCFAEVALECEWTYFTCGYIPPCAPGFADEELHLSAPPGGIAEGETVLDGVDLCGSWGVNSLADWAQVALTELPNYQYRVVVTADATGLDPGVHETWIRGTSASYARCMRVVFTVQDLISTRSTSWSQVKALYR